MNYMIRINVNISIVDMIDENFRKATNNSHVESECIDKTQLNLTVDENILETTPAEARTRFPSLERRLLDALGV